MNKTISLAAITILTASLAISGFAFQDAVAGVGIDANIDIRPGSDTNYIFTTSRGMVPVVLLNEDPDNFSLVDIESLQFGPANISPVFQFAADIDGDGDKDLISYFKQNESGIACGDTEATLSFDWDGDAYFASDNVTVVPCK